MGYPLLRLLLFVASHSSTDLVRWAGDTWENQGLPDKFKPQKIKYYSLGIVDTQRCLCHIRSSLFYKNLKINSVGIDIFLLAVEYKYVL